MDLQTQKKKKIFNIKIFKQTLWQFLSLFISELMAIF